MAELDKKLTQSLRSPRVRKALGKFGHSLRTFFDGEFWLGTAGIQRSVGLPPLRITLTV